MFAHSKQTHLFGFISSDMLEFITTTRTEHSLVEKESLTVFRNSHLTRYVIKPDYRTSGNSSDEYSLEPKVWLPALQGFHTNGFSSNYGE